jgi:asparagine synthase (glutamine-hydrolysing)
MAWSVELRVPLVDAWLRERLARNRFEPARTGGKAALVRLAAPELPEAVLSRPKSGFYVPVAEWMRPELAAKRPGERSRWLALRVLEEFGGGAR